MEIDGRIVRFPRFTRSVLRVSSDGAVGPSRHAHAGFLGKRY